jgi:hypothetical protein
MQNTDTTKTEGLFPGQKIKSQRVAGVGVDNYLGRSKNSPPKKSVNDIAYLVIDRELLSMMMEDPQFVDVFLDFVGNDFKTIESQNSVVFFGDTIDARAEKRGGNYVIEVNFSRDGVPKIVGLNKMC